MVKQQEMFLDDGRVLIRIPQFPDYYVDLEQGLIYSMRTGSLKRLKTYMRKGKHNYVTTTLTDLNDVSHCKGIHEFLMAAREQSWDWKYIFGLEINHINEDKADNTYENLELVTRKEQYTESVRRKISESKRGSNHHFAKLFEDDVKEIKERFTEWYGRKSEFAERISDEFGVSISCVNGIIYEQNWQHVI